MDAANVGKLTLKRFDGLHFITSIKLNKFSISSNGFASLSSFVIKQKRESAFLLHFGRGLQSQKNLKSFPHFGKILLQMSAKKVAAQNFN